MNIIACIAATVTGWLGSPDFRVREFASSLPWPAVAMVSPYHPDAEVRLRRRKRVPKVVQLVERFPWLPGLITKPEMYRQLWALDNRNRTALWYACYEFGFYYPCYLDLWNDSTPARPNETSWLWAVETLEGLHRGNTFNHQYPYGGE